MQRKIKMTISIIIIIVIAMLRRLKRRMALRGKGKMDPANKVKTQKTKKGCDSDSNSDSYSDSHPPHPRLPPKLTRPTLPPRVLTRHQRRQQAVRDLNRIRIIPGCREAWTTAESLRIIEKNWGYIKNQTEYRNFIMYLTHQIYNIWKNKQFYYPLTQRYVEKFCRNTILAVDDSFSGGVMESVTGIWTSCVIGAEVIDPDCIVADIYRRHKKYHTQLGRTPLQSEPLARHIMGRFVYGDLSGYFICLPAEMIAAICFIASKAEDVETMCPKSIVKETKMLPHYILQYELDVLRMINYRVFYNFMEFEKIDD